MQSSLIRVNVFQQEHIDFWEVPRLLLALGQALLLALASVFHVVHGALQNCDGLLIEVEASLLHRFDQPM